MGSAFKYTAIVHAGLAFPRNETYEPGDLMPIIFSFDQSNFNSMLHPQIQYTLSGDGADHTEPAVRLNVTTNVLEDRNHHTYLMPFWTDKFAKEGHYKISWTINVQQCDINATDSQNVDFFDGSTHPNGTKTLEFKAPDEDALAVYFTVQAGGLARNLTSIRNDSCHAGPGAAFNVTNLPPIGPTSYEPACVLYDQKRPFASSSSCNIIVDPSMDDDVNFFFQSYHLEEYCNSTNPPKSLHCYKPKNGAVQAAGNGFIITMCAALLTYFLIY